MGAPLSLKKINSSSLQNFLLQTVFTFWQQATDLVRSHRYIFFSKHKFTNSEFVQFFLTPAEGIVEF